MAVCGYENKATHCIKHRTNLMKFDPQSKCKTYGCDRAATHQFLHMCNVCSYNLGTSPTSRQTRESVVAQFVSETFASATVVLNRQIEEGCSKRRPDILIDVGFRVLLVEVDEN